MIIRLCLFMGLVGILAACSSHQHDLHRHSLRLEQAVPVIPAHVTNPYPQCEMQSSIRIADLSVSRAKRVYLEGGQLCQR